MATVADDRVSRALDEAGNAMATWARKLTDDRGVIPPPFDSEADQVAVLCRWFAEHMTSIATLDWCGEFVCGDRHEKGGECDGIGHHERRLQALTMTVAPGWYAGGCQRVVGRDEHGDEIRCDSGTYVIPGLTWVQCMACGTRTYARDHLETVLDEARGWVAGPMRIAEALVALLDTELSVPRLHKRISKWGERGQIMALRRLDADGDEVGPKRYRLGEVLDLLRTEGATRLDTPVQAAS